MRLLILSVLVLVVFLSGDLQSQVRIDSNLSFAEASKKVKSNELYDRKGSNPHAEVTVCTASNGFAILNSYTTGYGGHKIQLLVSDELEIVGADYQKWGDVEDGSLSILEVENVELVVNQDPLKEKGEVVGYYVLHISEKFFPGSLSLSDSILTSNYQVRGAFRY